MKKILIGLLGFCLICACTKKDEKVFTLIPKPKMVALLIDIHIAEATVLEKGYLYPDSAQLEYANLEAGIFRKHAIDTAFYRKSYQHYARNPQLLDEIYKIVIDSLSFKETVQPPDPPRNQPKIDSINKINEKNIDRKPSRKERKLSREELLKRKKELKSLRKQKELN
jgi:Domain of unknown function (DUF4296)